MLVRPVAAVGWELRTCMALGWLVRLVLSERCDGVYPDAQGHRILEGYVTSVSPTDAFTMVSGRHVPLGEILALHRPHYTQAAPSRPESPLDGLRATRAGNPPRKE